MLSCQKPVCRQAGELPEHPDHRHRFPHYRPYPDPGNPAARTLSVLHGLFRHRYSSSHRPGASPLCNHPVPRPEPPTSHSQDRNQDMARNNQNADGLPSFPSHQPGSGNLHHPSPYADTQSTGMPSSERVCSTVIFPSGDERKVFPEHATAAHPTAHAIITRPNVIYCQY